MKKIKVMTFNLKNDSLLTTKITSFHTRKKAIISIIRENKPDIIGVQEMSLPMKYELKKHLKEYDFYGNSRSNSKDRFNEHTDILVVKSKFEVTDHKTFWLSDTPNKVGSKHFFSLFPRICTYITIKEVETKESYRIFNSHLDPLLEGSRLKQIRMLLKELYTTYNNCPLPTVLMGDFNCTDNGEVTKLIGDHPIKFKSIYESNPCFNTYHFSLGKKFAKKSPIDYIYASNQMELNKFKIITDSYDGVYPSDHFPVIAEYYLN